MEITFKPSSVEGYYHIPPFWIVSEPPRSTIEEYSRGVVPEIVWQHSDPNGIDIYARRDGFFIFDCTQWLPGTAKEETVVPRDHNKIPYEDRNFEPLTRRILVINAFVCCLQQGMAKAMHCQTDIGPMISPGSHQGLTHINENPRTIFKGGHIIPYHALVAHNFDFGKDLNGDRQRLLVSREALNEAASLLACIINDKQHNTLNIINLMLAASWYYRNHDFGNSLLTAWIVAEAILFRMWGEYLVERQYSKSKAKKLVNARDFTPSVVTEILTLGGKLSHEESHKINMIRVARNNWVHEMKPVTVDAVNTALFTTHELVYKVTGIRTTISVSIVVPYVSEC